MSTSKKPKKQDSPQKVKLQFKKHLLPPIGGIGAMLLALAILNGQWIVANIRYKLEKPRLLESYVPTPKIADDKTKIDPNLPPKIMIPKIGVNAPIVFDEPSIEEVQVQKALKKGVLHYATTAIPGQIGNVALFGHSSGQPWAPGDFKFVFNLLDKLSIDDTIIVDYSGTEYTYKVTGTKIVKPTEVSVISPTDKSIVTIITCTPVGTSKNRLVVTAEQMSPAPVSEKAAATTPLSRPTSRVLPSASPSFWQSLKDLF
jgi:sortase A